MYVVVKVLEGVVEGVVVTENWNKAKYAFKEYTNISYEKVEAYYSAMENNENEDVDIENPLGYKLSECKIITVDVI